MFLSKSNATINYINDPVSRKRNAIDEQDMLSKGKKSKNSTNLLQISEDTNDDHGKSETSDLGKHHEKVNCHESHAGDTITRTFSAGSSSIVNVLSNTSKIDNEIKYNLIKNRVPPKKFIFPAKEYKDKSKKSGKRSRSYQHQWFEQFEFIVYSMEKDGIYCLPCILFPIENAPGGRAKLLITLPYNNWKDAVSDLKSHAVL